MYLGAKKNAITIATKIWNCPGRNRLNLQAENIAEKIDLDVVIKKNSKNRIIFLLHKYITTHDLEDKQKILY